MSLKYVPILKWKRGEQIALGNLESRIKDKLLPLVEIPPIEFDWANDKPKKTITEHIASVPNQISKYFGRNKIFIDLFNIYEEDLLEDRIHPIEYIINEGINLNLNIVPVVSSNINDEYNKAIQSLILSERINELCIRIEQGDFINLNNMLESIISKYNIEISNCHLVIDLKEETVTNTPTYEIVLPLLINNLWHQKEWSSITLAATSFPKTLEKIKKDTHVLIPRREFKLWADINPKLSRKIQFGDYCITNPEYTELDPRKISVSGNIRYTIDNNYLIFKGVNTKTNGFSQMTDMCKKLINSTYYSKQDFSWGDKYIYDVANNEQSTGNAETWRRVGTNHHLVFIVNSLSKFFYF